MVENPGSSDPKRPLQARLRLVLLVLLALAVIAAFIVVFTTPWGNQVRQDPHQIGQQVRAWTDRHPVLAPMALVATYVVLTLLTLPSWPLQVLSGYCLGLYLGSAGCVIGATLAAVTGWSIGRWLGGDWVRGHLEKRRARLRRVNQAMGHNGFLVVLCVRAVRIIPFGLSSYLFGLTRIHGAEVALGTMLGNLPGIIFYVGLGTDLALVKQPRFWVLVISVQVLALLPLALRYWKPGWFGRLGVR